MNIMCSPLTIQRVLMINPKKYQQLVESGFLIENKGTAELCQNIQRYIFNLNTKINNKPSQTSIDQIEPCINIGEITEEDIIKQLISIPNDFDIEIGEQKIKELLNV